MEKRPALGKGLSALIPDAPPAAASALDVDIHLLTPNTFQPRGQMDEERLDELARSIKANGVIQPIVVRRMGDRFHIIAGERRWRAAQRAGLMRVPIAIREVNAGNDQPLLELALIENIQRENLNPIDEALAYRRLSDEFKLTQDEIAAAVGKDRATVANMVRLLKLPQEIQHHVAAGRLTMGHARALLALPVESDQQRVARDIISRGLSVRETESFVRKESEAAKTAQETAVAVSPRADVHTRAAEERLRLVLGTRVRIVRSGKRGRVEIDFNSEDELIRLFDQLTSDK